MDKRTAPLSISGAPSAAFTDTKPHYHILDRLRGVAALTVVYTQWLWWKRSSRQTTAPLTTHICKFMGDVSYPFYIVHYPLFTGITRGLRMKISRSQPHFPVQSL